MTVLGYSAQGRSRRCGSTVGDLQMARTSIRPQWFRLDKRRPRESARAPQLMYCQCVDAYGLFVKNSRPGFRCRDRRAIDGNTCVRDVTVAIGDRQGRSNRGPPATNRRDPRYSVAYRSGLVCHGCDELWPLRVGGRRFASCHTLARAKRITQ